MTEKVIENNLNIYFTFQKTSERGVNALYIIELFFKLSFLNLSDLLHGYQLFPQALSFLKPIRKPSPNPLSVFPHILTFTIPSLFFFRYLFYFLSHYMSLSPPDSFLTFVLIIPEPEKGTKLRIKPRASVRRHIKK